jgi:hypothetical protein
MFTIFLILIIIALVATIVVHTMGVEGVRNFYWKQVAKYWKQKAEAASAAQDIPARDTALVKQRHAESKISTPEPLRSQD